MVTPDLESLPLPPGAQNGAAAAAAHRRHRSILETLGWGKPPKGSRSSASSISGDLDLSEEVERAVAASVQQHLGDGSISVMSSTASGDISTLEVEAGPELPAGTRGILNIGNSCFLNAALQCLRYTPGLALTLVPDLLKKAEEAAKERAKAALLAAESKTTKKEGETAGEEVPKENGTAAGEGNGAMPGAAAGEQGSSSDASSSSCEENGLSAIAVGNGKSEHGSIEDNAQKEENTTGTGTGGGPAADSKENQETSDKVPENKNGSAGEAPDSSPAPAPPTQLVAPPGSSVQLPRPDRGELTAAMAALFTELFIGGTNAGAPSASIPAASASALRTMLRRFPLASEYFDGRQQDCQEVLQIVLDLLHEDLNDAKKNEKTVAEGQNGAVEESSATAAAGNGKQTDAVELKEHRLGEESNGTGIGTGTANGMTNGNSTTIGTGTVGKASEEGAIVPLLGATLNGSAQPCSTSASSLCADGEIAKADAAWASWLRTGHSPISDLFMGQLQSSVTCSKCTGRFTMYEPYWELSLSLAPKPNSTFSWLSFKSSSGGLTLQDCLRAFTAGEKLEGKEAFHCEKCKEKTSATKHLRLHRLPDALVLHVKRFRHGGAGGNADKLTTDIIFPLKELDLHPYLSPESPHSPEACCYDLYAVSYHTGTLAGGHYQASCRVGPGPNGEDSWWQFNDDAVSPLPAGGVKTQHAYILFYTRRKYKDPEMAAVVFAAREAAQRAKEKHGHGHGHKHSRSRSGGSNGGGGFLFGGKSKAAGAATATAAAALEGQ